MSQATSLQAAAPAAEMNADFRGFTRLAFGAIGVVFGGFGLWAALAPLDSAAIAPARVTVEGERKPIQHLEGGIVREILVRDGETVDEGQVLFRLQPTQAQANTDVLRKQIDQAMAQEARLLAERDGAPRITFPAALLARRDIPETMQAMADQERQFAERKGSQTTQLAILKARVEQTTREMGGAERRMKALETQLDSYNQELGGVSQLAERGYYPKNKLLGLQREKTRVEGDLGQVQADKARLEQSLAEAQLQVRQAEQRIVEEVTQQLADLRGRISESREKLGVAEDVLYRVEVRSPRKGVVLGVKVRSPGTVVTPGSMLAEVVPANEVLVLQARVSPLDVQNVAAGQSATIRFPGLSSRQTPTIFGRVDTVSADSLVDDATHESYFAARVLIDRAQIPEDVMRKIQPGMPAETLITTGERTALAYLIGPLYDTITKAMRER